MEDQVSAPFEYTFMKTKFLLLAPVAGLALVLSPARAEDPAPASPDLQALFGQLSKMVAGANSKDDTQVDVKPLFDALLKLTTAMASAQGAQGTGNAQGSDAAAGKAAPAPAPAAKNSTVQDLQSLLTIFTQVLTKMASDDNGATNSPDPSSVFEPKPAPAPAAAPKAGLSTTGLVTGGLNVRTPPGVQVQVGGPRMTDSEWRQLFPAREDRR